MAVTIRGNLYDQVEPGTDRDTHEAVTMALALLKTDPAALKVTDVIVDRFDGMVLTTPSGTGWHFANLVAGHKDIGPDGAAMVLMYYGFGTYDDLLELIRQGGDRALYTFSRQPGGRIVLGGRR